MTVWIAVAALVVLGAAFVLCLGAVIARVAGAFTDHDDDDDNFFNMSGAA